MQTLTEAAAVIKTAESNLRELMQRALAVGDYRDLPALAKIGEQLAGMASRICSADDSVRNLVLDETFAPKAVLQRATRVKRSKSKTKNNYPKFKREGSRLVKIGWSKSEKAEYQHRAPSTVGRALMVAVQEVAKKKEVFAVDDLLPLCEGPERTEIPPHQVYLALAWLKAEGIVLPKGREGYTLLVPEEPSNLFEERWKALPSR